MSTILSPEAIAIPAAVVAPTRKRWSREEYYRLDQEGFFRGQRVELIDGEIILMSPHSPQHHSALYRVTHLLERVFGEKYVVRSQGPLVEGEYSEPEPDISVVRGSIQQFDFGHPTTALLIVEIAKTSLPYDTGVKQNLYALMDVPDYWVLDVVGRRLLIHREPIVDDSARFGRRYQSVTVVEESGTVSPLALPQATIAVAEMLPAAAQ